jgi:hypothetical protein
MSAMRFQILSAGAFIDTVTDPSMATPVSVSALAVTRFATVARAW